MSQQDVNLVCECCGYEGDELVIKRCLFCKHMFCRQCVPDHPCLEGKSNDQRESPFDKCGFCGLDKDKCQESRNYKPFIWNQQHQFNPFQKDKRKGK